MIKWALSKLRISGISIDAVKRMKIPASGWEKIFVNHISDKGVKEGRQKKSTY